MAEKERHNAYFPAPEQYLMADSRTMARRLPVRYLLSEISRLRSAKTSSALAEN